jgi:alcohol dehydrogenase class IV
VTDKGVIGAGLIQPVEKSLKSSRIKYAVFDAVEPDPRYEIVIECLEQVHREKVNLIIGIGGGSPIDIAKTSAIMATNKGDITEYFGIDLVPKPGLPTIMVPPRPVPAVK